MQSERLDDVNVILNAEADRRLDGVSKRAESAVTRATVMIATAAALLGGVQFVSGLGALRFVISAWLLFSIVLAVLVADFGTGHELPLDRYKSEAADYSRSTMLARVVNHKLRILHEDENAVSRQAALLRWSYFGFVLALLYALIAALLHI